LEQYMDLRTLAQHTLENVDKHLAEGSPDKAVEHIDQAIQLLQGLRAKLTPVPSTQAIVGGGDKIIAPWSPETVSLLSEFQTIGVVHPFTCRVHSDLCLLPTPKGWICPNRACDYTQDWALSIMANPKFIQSLHDQKAALQAKLAENKDRAGMVELADAPVSETGAERRAGSTPALGTK
jgi:hypothetical protein